MTKTKAKMFESKSFVYNRLNSTPIKCVVRYFTTLVRLSAMFEMSRLHSRSAISVRVKRRLVIYHWFRVISSPSLVARYLESITGRGRWTRKSRLVLVSNLQSVFIKKKIKNLSPECLKVKHLLQSPVPSGVTECLFFFLFF